MCYLFDSMVLHRIGMRHASNANEFNSILNHEEEIMKKVTLATVVGMFSGMALSTALVAGGDFATYDANQDGTISAEEAAVDVELSRNWSTIDADENGLVDAAEFSAFEGMGTETTPDAPMELQEEQAPAEAQ
jgi:Ca2+-binding EF-hand superfamily protein